MKLGAPSADPGRRKCEAEGSAPGPRFDPFLHLYIHVSLQEGLEAEDHRGLGRSPNGGLGADSPATFLRRSRLGSEGGAPSFILPVKPHRGGDGAPINCKLRSFYIVGQYV